MSEQWEIDTLFWYEEIIANCRTETDRGSEIYQFGKEWVAPDMQGAFYHITDKLP